jgi:hypothetical protein
MIFINRNDFYNDRVCFFSKRTLKINYSGVEDKLIPFSGKKEAMEFADSQKWSVSKGRISHRHLDKTVIGPFEGKEKNA